MIGEEAGDHLLVRRSEHEAAPTLVVEVEEDGPEGLLAAALPPQLDGLDGGQQHLLPAGGVHLLAHDVLGLEAGAAAEGHVAVGPRHELVDTPRAQQQPMARRLRIGGRLAQRASEQPGHPHGIEGTRRRAAGEAPSATAPAGEGHCR